MITLGETSTDEVTIDLREEDVRRSPKHLDPLKVVVFPMRAFLGLGWLRAGTEKLIELDWWTGDSLRTFLAEHRSTALPFMELPVDAVIRPAALFISLVVMLTQFAIGAAFITGRRLCHAIWVGIVLNVVFVMMGAVTPSAFYLVIQVSLLAALGQRSITTTSRMTRFARICACAVVAVLMAPYVTTLHPAEVIDDPALMLITVAGLASTVEILRLYEGSATAR